MQNQLISATDYIPEGISKSAFIKLLKQFDAYKERHQYFDFDDMLVACYFLLKNDTAILHAVQNQFKYILIDEFQDINRAVIYTYNYNIKPLFLINTILREFYITSENTKLYKTHFLLP